MTKKPRTPSELAVTKKSYSFSLIKSNMDKVAEMAKDNGVSVSEIIDEAVSYYLEAIKDHKPTDSN